MSTKMHDKEKKDGLNTISTASPRAKVAWTSPSAFFFYFRGLIDYISNISFLHVNSVTG